MTTIFKFLLVVAVVTASAVAFVGLRTRPDPTPTAPQPTSADLYGAASKLLQSQLTSSEIKILMLVMGNKDDDDHWNFRGSLDRASRNMPYFGTLRSVCPEFTSVACWKLASLNIDGQSYPIIDSNPAPSTSLPTVDAVTMSAQSAVMKEGDGANSLNSKEKMLPSESATDLATAATPPNVAHQIAKRQCPNRAWNGASDRFPDLPRDPAQPD